MSIKIIERKILQIVDAERDKAQIYWSESFNEDGTLVNSLALEQAVTAMRNAVADELALLEVLSLNLTEKEMSLILSAFDKLPIK